MGSVSFELLFWPWLEGASRIVLTDPYIRLFHQVRNLMELVEMLSSRKPPDEKIVSAVAIIAVCRISFSFQNA